MPDERRVDLRPAGPGDAPALAEIAAVSLKEPWSERSLEEELSRPRTRALLAEGEGRVVGFVLGWRVLDEAQVLALAVAPDRRRDGLGRALLGEYQRRMRAEGATRIVLEVRAGNTPAQRLYAAAGLRVEGRRPRFYSDGEDALLLGGRT